MGIFADLGPLSIFVPESLIPKTFQFTGNSYISNDEQIPDIKQQSVIKVRIEHIEMLDDNHLPSNTTSCVLKAMGALVFSR
jgi:DNA-directed RNA polymerase subunit E'/Rpb7